MSDTAHPFLDGKPKRLLIGGQWVNALSGKTFDSVNPATGKVIAQLAEGGAEDVDLAVAAARSAFEGQWSKFKPFDRQALMLKIADTLERRFDDLCVLETLDMGAPIARTSTYKRWIVQTLRFYAGQAVALAGETPHNSFPGDMFSYTLRAPLGVVGGDRLHPGAQASRRRLSRRASFCRNHAGSGPARWRHQCCHRHGFYCGGAARGAP